MSIKILHIMPMVSIYNKLFINMITDNNSLFEHHYYMHINNQKKYNFSCNINIFKNDKEIIKYIKFHYHLFDYLVFHSIPYNIVSLFRNKDIAKKVIWSVWGHDLYAFSNMIKPKIRKNFIKYFSQLKNFQKQLTKLKYIKNIHAITAGFPGDYGIIKKIFNQDIYYFDAGYPVGYNLNIINQKTEKLNNNISIMIGHSGFYFNNHLSILDKINKMKNNQANIYLPLNYGDSEYISLIKRSITNYPCLKIEIIENNIPILEYINFIKNVDVAIFDFKHQSALGNIYLLILFKKKLILNENGIIYKTLKEMGYNVKSTDILNNELEFSNYIKTINNFDTRIIENIIDNKIIKYKWKELFKTLYYF